MTGLDVLDVAREAIWVAMKVGMPMMVIALVVGTLISLVQALTQIQDMSVSFVPKIVAVFIGFIVLLPFMGATLSAYSMELFSRIRAMGDTPHR